MRTKEDQILYPNSFTRCTYLYYAGLKLEVFQSKMCVIIFSMGIRYTIQLVYGQSGLDATEILLGFFPSHPHFKIHRWTCTDITAWMDSGCQIDNYFHAIVLSTYYKFGHIFYWFQICFIQSHCKSNENLFHIKYKICLTEALT